MTRGDCPSEDVLGRYAAGEMSEAQAQTLCAHLGECADCVGRLDELAGRPDPLVAALRRPRGPGPGSNTELVRAVAAVLTPRAAPPGPEPGAVLNGYRVLEEIGRGGMGRVYRAAHPRLGREVALKLLRPGMDSAQVLARFEAERQTLALMDHPHVARVLDGGATEDGRPFFVMELVQGVAITRYCDEHWLDLRRRLELFAEVCSAVQHAHQKGIIHRDLKPSNVLVAEYDGRPVPKVIDFGVAKVLGGRSAAETEVGMLIGTPEYVSPEQANVASNDIDTRTDVYALGVLLYELLTGQTPFARSRLRYTPILEMLRVVREEDPPSPSTRLRAGETLAETAARRATDPAGLAKQVRGDLDWIVMKCLEKDRERRYETANALAMDLRRHLADEPVLASPPSAGYRLRKFARRHRGAFLGGVGSAALLLGAAAVSSWLAVRAASAEGRANDERDAALLAKDQADESEAVARAVSDFLQNDLLRQADGLAQARHGQAVKPNLTLREVLDRAAARIGGRFAGQPLVEAAVRLAIGDAYRGIGEAEAGLPHLKRALALRQAKLGAGHAEALAATDSLMAGYSEAGQPREALELLNEKVRLLMDHPGLSQADLRLSADVLDKVYHTCSLAEATRLHEETLELQKRAWGADHMDTLKSMHGLATAYQFASRDLDRVKLLEEWLALTAGKYGEEDLHTLFSMDELARAYEGARRPHDAIKLHERALPLLRAKRGPDHPDTLRCLSGLAQGYQAVGRGREAVPLHEEAAQLQTRKQGRDHPETLMALRRLGIAYDRAGDLTRAETLHTEVLALQRGRLSPDHVNTAAVLMELGQMRMKQGRDADAEACMREAVAIREKRFADDWVTADFRARLGEVLTSRKKYAEAEPLLLLAVGGLEPPAGGQPEPNRRLRLAEARQRLVRLYDAWGKPAEAARWRAKLPPAKAPEGGPP